VCAGGRTGVPLIDKATFVQGRRSEYFAGGSDPTSLIAITIYLTLIVIATKII